MHKVQAKRRKVLPKLVAQCDEVGVAQLVRAPGCGPGGRGFETHHSPHILIQNNPKLGLFLLIPLDYP